MVRLMVGGEVPLAWCGGNPDGGLGTAGRRPSMEAIDTAWSEARRRDPRRSRRRGNQQRDGRRDDRRAARKPHRDMQRADRRRRGDGRDRGIGRRFAQGSRGDRPRTRAGVNEREETMSATAAAQVEITHHAVGLHARPSVKFTKLAKTFAADIEMALAADGPWIDAKSIVKVMAAKAPMAHDALHLRASGEGRRAPSRRWSSWSARLRRGGRGRSPCPDRLG